MPFRGTLILPRPALHVLCLRAAVVEGEEPRNALISTKRIAMAYGRRRPSCAALEGEKRTEHRRVTDPSPSLLRILWPPGLRNDFDPAKNRLRVSAMYLLHLQNLIPSLRVSIGEFSSTSTLRPTKPASFVPLSSSAYSLRPICYSISA